ncbi:hypothetical protein HWI79_3775, partial [Cryptosporidium felis]
APGGGGGGPGPGEVVDYCEHVLVGAIVSDAENHLQGPPGGGDSVQNGLGGDPLVDSLQTDLDVVVPGNHVDGEADQKLREVVGELLCLPGSEVGLAVLELEHQSGALVLYVGALGPQDVLLHQLERDVLPVGD